MGLMEKDINAAYPAKSAKAVKKVNVAVEVDAQEEQIWNAAIENSLDSLRDMADKALAERRAGHTKKIRL